MAQEGISTLPQSPENQASYGEKLPFSQDLENIKAALAKDNPDYVPAYEEAMNVASQQIDLPIDQLQTLLTALEYILKNEREYPRIRESVIREGLVDEEDLPEQFDRGYFTTMLVMTQEAINRKRQQNLAMPEPRGFAKGGLADAAEALRQKGRGGDTILAHINPEEAMILKAMGGSGTINPATGLLEFKGGPIGAVTKAVGGAFKAVGNAVKSVVSSPVGKIVATVALTAALGPGGLAIGGTLGAGAGLAATAMAYAIPAAIASGAVSLAGGSNLQTALRESVVAGVSGGVFGGLSGSSGLLNRVVPSLGTGFLNTAVSGLGAGTIAGLASGQKIGDALRTGAISGVTAGGISALSGQSAFGTETPAGAPIVDKSTAYTPGDVSASQITETGGSIAGPSSVSGTAPAGSANQFGGLRYTGEPYQVGLRAPTGSEGIGSLSPSLPSSAGAPTVPTPGSYQPAGFMDRAGAFFKSPSLSSFSDMIIPPSPTPEQLMNSDIFKQATAQGASFSTAMSMAKEALSPGMIAKYGPAVGLGIGALAMGGGFQSQPATPPGLVQRDAQGNVITGEDLIAQDPSRYVVQNLQGVNYNPGGGINFGPGSNTPAYGMSSQVPTPAYGMQTPSYTPPMSAASQTPGVGIMQPYNTMANYNFMNTAPYYQPQRYYNMGGPVMGYEQGGFPRKMGHIEGPGTGTSDSIPAMLSDGEFVLTAKAVKGIGNGSRRAGAKKLYRMMHAMEKKAGGSV